MNAELMESIENGQTESTEATRAADQRRDRRAIAALFPEARGTLDVKVLWQRGGGRFYRVNWWTGVEDGDAKILRSAFVRIDEADGEIKITDDTRRSTLTTLPSRAA